MGLYTFFDAAYLQTQLRLTLWTSAHIDQRMVVFYTGYGIRMQSVWRTGWTERGLCQSRQCLFHLLVLRTTLLTLFEQEVRTFHFPLSFAKCWKCCTVAFVMPDAKLLASNIVSGLLCLATQIIWPILDHSGSFSFSQSLVQQLLKVPNIWVAYAEVYLHFSVTSHKVYSLITVVPCSSRPTCNADLRWGITVEENRCVPPRMKSSTVHGRQNPSNRTLQI